MTLLPTSEQTGDLDNLAVTRAEFRSEIGILLEYVAQALGSVSGTYTTETVDPFNPELQGTPTLEIGAEPVTGDSTLRIPTTQWVKKSGRYVGATAPTFPEIGMLWVDTTNNPFTIRAYDGSNWDIVSGVPSGTRMLFQQSAAPVGWTKDTSNNNMALRLVSGATNVVSTEQDFTSVFGLNNIDGTVANTVLTTSQMPRHSHGISDSGHGHSVSISDPGHAHGGGMQGGNHSGGGKTGGSGGPTHSAGTGISASAKSGFTGVSVQNNGSGQGHNHGFTGTDLDLSINYVDVIIAEKN